MSNVEIKLWESTARAEVEALWRARHGCANARAKTHYWVRMLRTLNIQHHKYAKD